MYIDRIPMYKKMEKEFDSKLLVYVTGDRPNMGTQIGADVIDFFIEQLDNIGDTKRISLYLYTRGGDVAAAWNIVNLLRMFCEELQVIIPHKAHSAGTIISIGANEIVMTKQATLSPIDPSVNTPLNPVDKQNQRTLPVSVEAVKGYLEFAKEELEILDVASLANIYIKLTDNVHPLVLGQTYRTRSQIQRLASKLLKNQVDNDTDIKNISDFLCSDSGSHDYTINRREAEELKLKVRKPTSEQYTLIKGIYDDIHSELQLGSSFEIKKISGEYSVRRSLLESIEGGSDYFVREGKTIFIRDEQEKNVAIQDVVMFEGWRHDAMADCYDNSMMEGGIEYERTDEFQL